MLFVSQNGTKIIVAAMLVGFALLTFYFINEVKKIEMIYDDMLLEALEY